MAPFSSMSPLTCAPIQQEKPGSALPFRASASRKTGWGIQMAYGYSGEMTSNANRAAVRPPTSSCPSVSLRWGCSRMYSSSPIRSSSRGVLGCSTSPRNSRSKFGCPSRTITSAPRFASIRPSRSPAGPPPTMQAFVRVGSRTGFSSAMRRPSVVEDGSSTITNSGQSTTRTVAAGRPAGPPPPHRHPPRRSVNLTGPGDCRLIFPILNVYLPEP